MRLFACVVVVCLVGCRPHRGAPDAGLAAGACPRPVHPDYCRHRCRTFTTRKNTLHARRVLNPLRAGTGTCGAYDVFAEDTVGPDGGPGAGIVEYFDVSGGLVGAVDTRIAAPQCGTFGAVPACTPSIQWGPPSGHFVQAQPPPTPSAKP
jgi:hypothetical protein